MFSTSPKFLRRAVFVAALSMTTWAGAAFAQNPSTEPPPDSGEKDNIQNYLNNHPEQAKQLHENPSLINDPNWLKQNPKVATFLQKHPDMKERATTDPHSFINRSEAGTLKGDHAMLNKSDRYLDQHPEMKKELAANPRLIDDPKYLSEHPGLENELKEHPEIRNEAMNHPEQFKKAMERNERYDQRHDKPSSTHPAKAPRSTGAKMSATGVKK
jgi:hypothetical protein